MRQRPKHTASSLEASPWELSARQTREFRAKGLFHLVHVDDNLLNASEKYIAQQCNCVSKGAKGLAVSCLSPSSAPF